MPEKDQRNHLRDSLRWYQGAHDVLRPLRWHLAQLIEQTESHNRFATKLSTPLVSERVIQEAKKANSKADKFFTMQANTPTTPLETTVQKAVIVHEPNIQQHNSHLVSQAIEIATTKAKLQLEQSKKALIDEIDNLDKELQIFRKNFVDQLTAKELADVHKSQEVLELCKAMEKVFGRKVLPESIICDCRIGYNRSYRDSDKDDWIGGSKNIKFLFALCMEIDLVAKTKTDVEESCNEPRMSNCGKTLFTVNEIPRSRPLTKKEMEIATAGRIMINTLRQKREQLNDLNKKIANMQSHTDGLKIQICEQHLSASAEGVQVMETINKAVERMLDGGVPLALEG